MILPSLPAFITSLGGADYKGMIIAVFTITAMGARPFSGNLADRIGRRPVIMVGSVVCAICSLIYPETTTVWGMLLVRFVHGFSTGFTPTGQTAYLADIIPFARRGEAMGILGTASAVGMAGGPAAGGLLESMYGFSAMCYCSSGFAVLSIVVLLGMKETIQERHALHPRVLKVNRSDMFEPRVLAPCIVMVFSAFCYGGVITLLPDFSEFVGVKNAGLLFTYLTIASLTVRLIGGKASDRWGRKNVLRVSVTGIAIGMLIIAFAQSKMQLIFGVIIYGMSHGTTSPTLLAWATDLSDNRFKGRGIASLFIFMELGIGVGALACAALFDNQYENFMITFMVCAGLAILGLLYLAFERSSQRVAYEEK
jgi:MFS family permease